MKFISIITIAFVMLLSSSCSKERHEPTSGNTNTTITVIAENPALNTTKTEINEMNKPLWSAGDMLTVTYYIENQQHPTQHAAKLDPLKSTLTVASETAEFTGSVTIPEGTPYIYLAYPSIKNLEKDPNATEKPDKIKIELAENQKPTQSSFDKMSDILVAKPVPGSQLVSPVRAQFARANATALFTFDKTNVTVLGAEEKLESFTLETAGTNIAGVGIIDAETGLFTAVAHDPGIKKTVTADYPGVKDQRMLDKAKVYLNLWPCTLPKESTVTIKGVTTNHTFEKTVTLPEDYIFRQSSINKITLSLADENFTERTIVKGEELPKKWTFNNATLPSDLTYTNDKGYAENSKGGAGIKFFLNAQNAEGSIKTGALDLSKPITITVDAFQTKGSTLIKVFIDGEYAGQGHLKMFNNKTPIVITPEIKATPETPATPKTYTDHSTVEFKIMNKEGQTQFTNGQAFISSIEIKNTTTQQ